MTAFERFREKHPVFSFDGFDIKRGDGEIIITYAFSLAGGPRFEPVTRIKTDNLNILNPFDGDEAREIIFALGMVEAVSYWKAACAPVFEVKCGALSESDVRFWKSLWFGGLGEFFYRNGIETDFDSFVTVKAPKREEKHADGGFVTSGINIIPIGGGKDSAVTTELLKDFSQHNMFFTVNDQPARTDCVLAAGYDENRIIKTYRTIDKALLELNACGYLNGHTPFSAIVAFLSGYCAYLTGAQRIILSNEASANESNIGSTKINHQFSKAFEFENDFCDYAARHFGFELKYFSILRAFNELQIAKQFARLPQYLGVFRSCNAGSKKNIWCGKCAKCLFVYIILSPFVSSGALEKTFGCNMLDKPEMLADFDGLCGFSGVKPFECVGTAGEIRAALDLTVQNSSGKLPFLLESYRGRRNLLPASNPAGVLSEFNAANNIPEEYLKYVKEMYAYVSGAD